MNKLNTEALTKDFCINYEKITYRPLEITQEYRIYKSGLEYAENHYLAELEKVNKEWDAETARCIAYYEKLKAEFQQLKQEHVKSCDDFGEFREKLQHELQTAKELLKEAYEAMGRISYKHKQFFSKQKIEEFLKQ